LTEKFERKLIVKDLTEVKRGYQAEVHFALGAVIQGITVAALGGEIATALKNLPFPGAPWVFITGLQSLLLCIAFWFTFISNYSFGFRVINLTARAHFLLAAQYLVLGLLQLLAIQFLADPRSWLTFYLLLITTTLVGSWTMQHVTVIDHPDVREAMAYDPGSKVFFVTFVLALIIVILWYTIPNIDTNWFRAIAMLVSGTGLVLINYFYILVFQKQLNVEH
jgi:cytochrome bd-type quinol oxidase subunit 2